MHRIDTATAQKDKFGAGKNGFTRGNPQTGTPATDLDDDYFDMLQEELAGVVEASGVNLEKSKHNQLLTALKALLLSRSHPFADIKADGSAAVAEALSNLGFGQSVASTGFAILPGELIFQWGTATGDQGNLGAASPMAFKQRVFQVLLTLNDKTAGAVDGVSLYATQCNFTNKTSLIVQNKGKDLLGVTTASYFAIGK